MTRFGVMKHLGILEEAGLITTKKVGREKLHYINRDTAAWVMQYRQFWEQRFDRLEEALLKIQEQEKEDDHRAN
jgi:predicted transcriptional regulator